MKFILTRTLSLLALLYWVMAGCLIPEQQPVGKEYEKTPNDWFFMQRAFPYDEINYAARAEAWEQVSRFAERTPVRGSGWVFEGPLNIGGRISALAMHSADMETIYAGAASGGVFKSSNGGQSWTAIFEDALSLSIGDIAIAESDPSVVYVGTGEANAGGGSMSYDGFGIYKSSNSGWTWEHLGLENCGSVGRIAIDPGDPQKVFVAAMGRLFSDNPDRGVFRSTDGGASWEKVLYLNDSTGAIDVLVHPVHTDTVFAAMWERVRRQDRRSYGGYSCGIYRSYDGGDSWTQLTTGLPSPGPDVGRIGIDIAASDPDILYAIYADKIGYFAGVFKSTDGGDTWTRTNDGSLSGVYSSYGWWFGRISIDPTDPDIAFVIGFDLYRTIDGGNSWAYVSSGLHVDQHDLIVHPMDPSYVVLGNDGGFYASQNGGSAWTFINNLPITQFYTCEIDEQYPERLYGGTQDNGTNRTVTGGLDDWQNIYGGDGFYVLVDPVNNSYVYAEYQYGNLARSLNGGYSFSYAMSGISGSDRMNWNTPVVFDPSDPSVLYYGANRLYKSTNRAQNWQPISPDLTDGPGSSLSVVYGTITTISPAASNNLHIYVGTDDGNVWHTGDGGENWTNISSSLPQRWVTRVAADPYDEEIVYVTLSGYRYDSYLPHVFRSEDAGNTWTDITGDLPDAPVNDIIIDPLLDSTLYLATDFGVFVTWDLGAHWFVMGDNLPNVPVVDLDFHQASRTLIAATYGRSMYSFEVDQLVGNKESCPVRDEQLTVFPNPFRKDLSIRYMPATRASEYQILSVEGKVLSQGYLFTGSSEIRVDASKWPAGSYFIQINDGRNQLIRKLLKTR